MFRSGTRTASLPSAGSSPISCSGALSGTSWCTPTTRANGSAASWIMPSHPAIKEIPIIITYTSELAPSWRARVHTPDGALMLYGDLLSTPDQLRNLLCTFYGPRPAPSAGPSGSLHVRSAFPLPQPAHPCSALRRLFRALTGGLHEGYPENWFSR